MNGILKNTSKVILLSLLVTVFGQSAKAMENNDAIHYVDPQGREITIRLPQEPQKPKGTFSKAIDWIVSPITFPISKLSSSGKHLRQSMAHALSSLKEGGLCAKDLTILAAYIFALYMGFKIVEPLSPALQQALQFLASQGVALAGTSYSAIKSMFEFLVPEFITYTA